MKINTITCHNVYNVGASLQTYAFLTYLESLDHQVEIIDYQPWYLADRHKLSYVPNEKYRKNFIIKMMYILYKMPERLKYLPTKKIFDTFHKQNYKLTKKQYRTINDLEQNPPIADLYFAGSDQIWNTLFENGKDSAFYLNFVKDDKAVKASYAASFATESVIDEYKERVSKWINNLDFVAVREKSGIDILNNLGIYNGVTVVDPVFLLDKKFWLDKCHDYKTNKRYLLVYDFEHNVFVEETARLIAKKYNLEIWSIFDMESADRKLKKVGPLEFLTYIRNADFILSNSFHATAFSLIFNKEFCVINRNENINTRMRDMLETYNIPERLITSINDIDNMKEIDYKNINNIMCQNIELSKKYIDDVIEYARKRREVIEE